MNSNDRMGVKSLEVQHFRGICTKKTVDLSKINRSKTLKYDLDGDGKKDVITIKNLGICKANTEYEGVLNYEIKINGKVILSGIENTFGILRMRLIDFNKNDKSVEIVFDRTEGGEDFSREIYRKNGKKIGVIDGSEGDILINGKGKIFPINSVYINVSPYVSNHYYVLSKRNFKDKKLKVSKIQNKKFTARYKNAHYVESIKKYEKKDLKKGIKFKIIEFTKDGYVKIEFNNGKTGYIVAN